MVLGFGADNLPYAFYERTADGAVREITEELPFEIPETWEWVRVKDICELQNGRAFKPSDWKQHGTPIVRIQNLNNPLAQFNLFDGAVDEKFILHGGELLFAWSGTPGTSFGAHIWEGGAAVLNQHIFRVDYNSLAVYREYYKYALNYRVAELISLAHGAVGLRHVTKGVFESTSIPLPPLAEQHRIVARIEELLPHIANYDIVEQKLTALTASFPNALKKSILQAAVQGKLAPQDPADEPASVLLERIRAEKAALIKAGKAKKDKHESVIFRRDNSYYEKLDGIERCIDNEIPFDVPDSWEWARLQNLIQLISGQDMTPDKYSSYEMGIPYLTGASNIENEAVIINRWTTEPKAIALQGDLLITCKGTVGAMAFLKNESVHIARQIMAIRMGDFVCSRYIKAFAETYVATLKVAAKSMIPGISREDILTALVPIPPLAEQLRIVDMTDELELSRQGLQATRHTR
jgi:type I restriction enzyme S subunit